MASYYKKLPEEVKGAKTFQRIFTAKDDKFADEVAEDPSMIEHDPIYYFECIGSSAEEPNNKVAFKSLNIDLFTEPTAIVAGIAALRELVTRISPRQAWEPESIDLTFLGCELNTFKTVGSINIIQRAAKTVAQLLSSLDISCCRVAHLSHNTFLASRQALMAIASKKFYLSEDLLSESALGKHLKSDEKVGKFLSFHHKRMAVYQQYGFQPVYVKHHGVMALELQLDSGANFQMPVEIPSFNKISSVYQYILSLAEKQEVVISFQLRTAIIQLLRLEGENPKANKIEKVRQIRKDSKVVEEAEGSDQTDEEEVPKFKPIGQAPLGVVPPILVRKKKEEPASESPVISSNIPTTTGLPVACDCGIFEAREKEIIADIRKLVYQETKLSNKELRIALHTQLAKFDEIGLLRSLSKS